jgi:hypothetical protein
MATYKLIAELSGVSVGTVHRAGVPTVGYDLVSGNVHALRDGRIAFLLNQRPYAQGYRARRTRSEMSSFGVPSSSQSPKQVWIGLCSTFQILLCRWLSHHS